MFDFKKLTAQLTIWRTCVGSRRAKAHILSHDSWDASVCVHSLEQSHLHSMALLNAPGVLSFCFTPPMTKTPTPDLLTGTRQPTHAPSHWGGQSGLWPTPLLSQNVRQASSLDSDASNISGNPSWIQMMFKGAHVNRCRAEIKTQQRFLWLSRRRQSLREPSTEIASQVLCSWWEAQWIDLGIVYVNNNESISSSWWRTETPTSRSSRRCSTLLKGWSWNNHLKFWMFLRRFGISRLGWVRLCVTIKSSSCMSTQIQFMSGESMCTQSNSESMGNQLSSSGIFSQDLQRWRSFNRSERIWMIDKKSSTIWRKKYLHVNVQWHCLDKERKVLDFSSLRKYMIMQKRCQRRHWSFFGPGEKDKWYGTYAHKPERKWDEDAYLVIGRSLFFFFGHPIFLSISAFNRGILKMKGRWSTVHFTAESSNIELLFRTLHSANQLSIHGAVSTGVKNLLKRFLVNSFTSGRVILKRTTSYRKSWIRKKWIPWYVIERGLREQLETACTIIWNDSEDWIQKSNSVKLESAGFMRLVSVALRYRNIQEVDDGFGDRTRSCREITLSHGDPRSAVKLWIKSCTEIGPVLEVITICHIEIHGIGIKIPSTCGGNTNSWVVISRLPNRSVDELRYTDPDSSPANFEEADYGSTEETHARQPMTQSRSQRSQSEDHIPIHKTEWVGITAEWIWPQIPQGNSYLEMCHETGATCGSSRKRIWWGISLEIDEFKAMICVPERCRKEVLWWRMDRSHLGGKQ